MKNPNIPYIDKISYSKALKGFWETLKPLDSGAFQCFKFKGRNGPLWTWIFKLAIKSGFETMWFPASKKTEISEIRHELINHYHIQTLMLIQENLEYGPLSCFHGMNHLFSSTRSLSHICIYAISVYQRAAMFLLFICNSYSSYYKVASS